MSVLLGELPFVVRDFHCLKRFEGWVRTNRNNRIARKWRKRYGPRLVCRQDHMLALGGLYVMCPHQYQAILANFLKGGTR